MKYLKIIPSLEDIQQTAQGANKVPIALEMYMDLSTPIGVLSRIRELHERYFLLESMEGGEKLARYTFIGFHPSGSFYVKEGKSFYVQGERVEVLEGNPFEHLKTLMSQYRCMRHPCLPPFTGGAVGYFGYDMAGYMEHLPKAPIDPLKANDMKLMFFDEVIAFDHYQQKMYLMTHIDGSGEEVEEAYTSACTRLKSLMHFVTQPMKRNEVIERAKVRFEPMVSKESYIDQVEQAKAFIRQGDIFQVVLSQGFKASMPESLLDVYRVLRTVNPSPYMYLMKFDDLELAGASPETLVKVQGREVMTMPIAGTRPRGNNEDEDRILEVSLVQDPKECAEHNMLVDLGRNDVGRMSQIGSVEVTQYMAVQRFSHVMHLTSTVRGQLEEGRHSVDALAAILPAGTLSGAPKIRAMEIITALEGQKRGIYGGGIGYIGYDGNLDTCIAIRTVVRKDGMAYVQAGAGIVLDSVPEVEYQECLNKAGALFAAIGKVGEII